MGFTGRTFVFFIFLCLLAIGIYYAFNYIVGWYGRIKAKYFDKDFDRYKKQVDTNESRKHYFK